MFKRFTGLLAAASLVLLSGAALAADVFPSRTVNIVVAYPPGGSTDVAARLLAQTLAAKLGQPFVVDNRAGAGGMIGAAYVAHAAPDGYSLLFGSSAELSLAPVVKKNLPISVEQDLRPVAMVASVPFVLVANNSFPPNNVTELIAYAKAHPNEVNFSSFGNGTSSHLAGELLNLQAGMHMMHVPYKGSSPSLTDLMGGQIQVSFDTITAVMPLIQAGKIKPLGIATLARSPLLPHVPTVSESGMPGFVGGTWFGLMAPKATPDAVVATMTREVTAALKTGKLANELIARGLDPAPRPAGELNDFMKSETAKWKRVVDAIGLQPE
ncbi:tripartite tricarboxylate transporter substrate binding protein [Xylophilus rhododendri]|uniref:Tripartite tricarboxylate transporter substrate binding protein n=1 Tax=Xylophilus rhododendri TaxID=2697032 RepID=A0A857JAJ0_9BURK|nr:tripartite tricarboxylate transporter substrate binding protein [Xylophilus rhododendri]QHJ00937.1 tripartite tricarboxylate transporter substrate binding protein [Xylophilus rhododendri]